MLHDNGMLQLPKRERVEHVWRVHIHYRSKHFHPRVTHGNIARF
jgi:hypothetical protein